MHERLISDLLYFGQIAQDGEEDVSRSAAQEGCDRFAAAVDRVTGNEGIEVLRALVRSMLSPDDYEVYECVWSALERFPAGEMAVVVVEEVPFLIGRRPDRAGELLHWIAADEDRGGQHAALFNGEFERADEAIREPVRRFVRAQEKDGWLKDVRRVLLPESA